MVSCWAFATLTATNVYGANQSISSQSASSQTVVTTDNGNQPVVASEHRTRATSYRTSQYEKSSRVERTSETSVGLGVGVGTRVANDIVLYNFPELTYRKAPSSVAAQKAIQALDVDPIFNQEGALAIVKKAGKYGLVGLDGGELIPPTYKNLNPVYDIGALQTTTKKTNTYLDIHGQELVGDDLKNRFIKSAQEDLKKLDQIPSKLSVFKDKGKYGFKDIETQAIVIPPQYKEVYTGFSEGIAFVKNNAGQKVAINEEGKELFEAPYDTLYPFRDGLAEYHRKVSGFNFGSLLGTVIGGVISGGDNIIVGGLGGGLTFDGVKRGYINKDGQVVIDSHKDAVYPMTPYGTFIKNDGAVYFVDRTGKTIIPTGNYDIGSMDITNGLLSLKDKTSDKYAIYSAVDGKKLIDYQFDKVEFIGGNRMVATIKGSKELVDLESGKSLQAFDKNTEFTAFGLSPVTWIKENGNYYIIDKHGQVQFNGQTFKLSQVTPFVNGHSAVKVNGKWGVVNAQGQWLAQALYDEVNLL